MCSWKTGIGNPNIIHFLKLRFVNSNLLNPKESYYYNNIRYTESYEMLISFLKTMNVIETHSV